MTRRYFSAEPIASTQVALRGEEAHHLLHVLRASRGMQVVLFDGTGFEFDAEVASCGRTSVDLMIVQRREVGRELPFSLTLGVALPKGERQRWLVEKVVELGVTRLVPLRTERSQATGDKPGDKLARYVVEASKQWGRNRLLPIEPVHEWAQWLGLPKISGADASTPMRLWVADQSGAPVAEQEISEKRDAFIAIGPEGGFSENELAAAHAAGWQPITLGPRTLRVETAAVALAALFALRD
jgi:16S rRNA (uracil1498-N3)-methyltransferase